MVEEHLGDVIDLFSLNNLMLLKIAIEIGCYTSNLY